MYNFLEVLELAIKILEQELYNWYAEEEDKIEVMSTEFLPFKDDVEVLTQQINISNQMKYVELGLSYGKDVYEQKRHLENILKSLEEHKDNPLTKRYKELSAQWTGIFSMGSCSKDSKWGAPNDLVSDMVKEIRKGQIN